jgi:membrane protein YdbS with pleckstrin-like domain
MPRDADPGGGSDWAAPSPRLGTLRHAQTAATAVVAALASVGIGAAAGATGAGLVAALAVLAAAGVVDLSLARRVRAWGFAEREADLLVRRGVLFRRLSVIPYGRMQYVDVTAGPWERAFGLATVRMHTAAAASDARIPGLTTAQAARLRDQLSALGESQAAGL